MSLILCPYEGCEGVAVPTRMDGRFYFHRNVHINLSPDFEVPRCQACHHDVIPDSLNPTLQKELERSYQEHAELVRKCIQRFEALQ